MQISPHHARGEEAAGEIEALVLLCSTCASHEWAPRVNNKTVFHWDEGAVLVSQLQQNQYRPICIHIRARSGCRRRRRSRPVCSPGVILYSLIYQYFWHKNLIYQGRWQGLSVIMLFARYLCVNIINCWIKYEFSGTYITIWLHFFGGDFAVSKK